MEDDVIPPGNNEAQEDHQKMEQDGNDRAEEVHQMEQAWNKGALSRAVAAVIAGSDPGATEEVVAMKNPMKDHHDCQIYFFNGSEAEP